MTTSIIEYRIGRNVGTTPMSEMQWSDYIEQARAILDGAAAGLQRETANRLTQWTEVHTGMGTWTDEDGTEVREESAVVTLYTDSDTLDEPLHDLLVELAGDLAARFEQDAVALVFGGVSTLVPAVEVAR
jgi:hypothetical protein